MPSSLRAAYQWAKWILSKVPLRKLAEKCSFGVCRLSLAARSCSDATAKNFYLAFQAILSRHWLLFCYSCGRRCFDGRGQGTCVWPHIWAFWLNLWQIRGNADISFALKWKVERFSRQVFKLRTRCYRLPQQMAWLTSL